MKISGKEFPLLKFYGKDEKFINEVFQSNMPSDIKRIVQDYADILLKVRPIYCSKDYLKCSIKSWQDCFKSVPFTEIGLRDSIFMYKSPSSSNGTTLVLKQTGEKSFCLAAIFSPNIAYASIHFQINEAGLFEATKCIPETIYNVDSAAPFIAIIASICAFEKYAQVETRIIERNSVYKTHNIENKSCLPIEYHFSTYYTTVLHKGDFSVKGHFRLQPYKDGKRLIYIEPYVKHGYTRKASILNK